MNIIILLYNNITIKYICNEYLYIIALSLIESYMLP